MTSPAHRPPQRIKAAAAAFDPPFDVTAVGLGVPI